MFRLGGLEMRRTLYLLETALLMSAITFFGFVCSVRAYRDDNRVEGQYCWAEVDGSYPGFWRPYFEVHHGAGIIECLSGRCRFIAWDRNAVLLYDVWGILAAPSMELYYTSPIKNVIWFAESHAWAPMPFPIEHIVASIGPPGSR
jgi:hypothetical protein